MGREPSALALPRLRRSLPLPKGEGTSPVQHHAGLTERFRLARRDRRVVEPALPEADIDPAPGLVPRLAQDAGAAETARFVQPDHMVGGQRDDAYRMGEALSAHRVDQRVVQLPSIAAPLRALRQIDAGLYGIVIRRTITELGGIGIAEHRPALALGHHQPGIITVRRRHARPHRALVGRLQRERHRAGLDIGLVDRRDLGGILRRRGSDRDHHPNFASSTSISRTLPLLGAAPPSPPHSRQRACTAAPVPMRRTSPSAAANIARRSAATRLNASLGSAVLSSLSSSSRVSPARNRASRPGFFSRYSRWVSSILRPARRAASATASCRPPKRSTSPSWCAVPPSHTRPWPISSTRAGVRCRACDTRVTNWR